MESFFAHRSPQIAAGVSYFALFSIFPLAILITAGFSLVVDDDAAHSRVVDLLIQNVPLTEGQGRARLEGLFESAAASAPAFGAVGVLGLLFSASGLMAALRHGVNTAHGIEQRRTPLRGKALDVLLVFAVILPVALSLALTVTGRFADSLGDRLADLLGTFGSLLPRLLLATTALGPLVLSFATFAFLYVVLPARATSLRDVWPGALAAAVAYEVTKIAFSVYLENVGGFDAVYGSIGAVIAFLVFVFIAANVFLLGAEVSARWPEVRGGDYREEEPDGVSPTW
ncbi:MAG: YihY/virulence factor BrkB family protein [Solirubrobacteraceae bacterium]